jgi:hypothetical protein
MKIKYFVIYALFSFFFAGCEDKQKNENAIARVNDKYLMADEFLKVLPETYTKEDSIQLRSIFINDWATHQLLLDKARINIEDNKLEIDELVEKYRRELLIEKYKEALINKFLDTVVTNADVDQYYQLNKDVYKLNEELVQIRFIHFNKTMKDGKELVKLFKSKNLKDINALNDKRLEFNSFNLNDSIWVSYKEVQEKLPFLPEGNNLKKVDFLQKDDSLGVYLVAINRVLNINEIAPKSYVESTIKKMILHKRKLDLFVEIEKSLLSDAVEDNNFEVY